MGRIGQHYMTAGERQQLEALARAGHTVAEIAGQLGFCRQTIYNELRVGAARVVRRIHGYDRDVVEYSADKAQQVHAYKQTAKGAPLKIGRHHAYARRLENLMLGVQPDGTVDKRQRYSPASALAQAKAEGYPVSVCPATLYSYIDKGVFRHLDRKDLWAPRKKRKRRGVQRIAHPLLPSIVDRPAEINQRQELGHYEMDLVVGAGNSKEALLTLTERKSRMEIIIKLPDKTQESILRALASVRAPIRSITTDNGPEFLAYDEIKEAVPSCQEVYYCHSYAAWEKGSNEVHNRMIRRWYPKGTKFSEVTQEELDDLARFLNHYPRKVLGWRCPAEVMEGAPARAKALGRGPLSVSVPSSGGVATSGTASPRRPYWPAGYSAGERGSHSPTSCPRPS